MRKTTRQLSKTSNRGRSLKLICLVAHLKQLDCRNSERNSKAIIIPWLISQLSASKSLLDSKKRHNLWQVIDRIKLKITTSTCHHKENIQSLWRTQANILRGW